MDIKSGKYTLRSDSQCFWIEETRVAEKEDGIMIDDGGTTVAEEEDEEIEKFFAEARGTGEQE